MPIDYATELPGRQNAVDFALAMTVLPTLSTDFQKVTIPFTGSANPTRTSTVDIITTQYSMNDGVTWNDMTLDAASDTADLTFSTTGDAYEIIWLAKTDIGTQVYNNNIKIKLEAQDTFDGDVVVTTKTRYLSFSRSVTNSTTTNASPFPDDYAGTLGMSLLKYAPRQTT